MMAMQVAHEIKNPLTPIKLGAQQLERAWSDQKEDFDERLRRYTRVVVEQIDILSEIAQDFSMLAAVGLGEREDVDLKNALGEVIELYRQSHPEVSWQLDVPTEAVTMQGSKQHVTRALNNLISNAVDATKEIEVPSIHASIECVSNRAVIRVRDNGVGIEPDRIEAIFQPRFTLKKHGTGLGLTIAPGGLCCLAPFEQLKPKVFYEQEKAIPVRRQPPAIPEKIRHGGSSRRGPQGARIRRRPGSLGQCKGRQ